MNLPMLMLLALLLARLPSPLLGARYIYTHTLPLPQPFPPQIPLTNYNLQITSPHHHPPHHHHQHHEVLRRLRSRRRCLCRLRLGPEVSERVCLPQRKALAMMPASPCGPAPLFPSRHLSTSLPSHRSRGVPHTSALPASHPVQHCSLADLSQHHCGHPRLCDHLLDPGCRRRWLLFLVSRSRSLVTPSSRRVASACGWADPLPASPPRRGASVPGRCSVLGVRRSCR